MTRYLILFKPLETFFFGGEITFGNGENQNYLVKSNPFPQQTTLLGTLRKEILIQAGCLKPASSGYELDGSRKSEVEDLIGPGSFNISKGHQSFGCIQRISPVFLARETASGGHEFFTTGPLDRDLKFTRKNGTSWCSTPNRPLIPLMQGYKAKDGLKERFIRSGLNVSTNEYLFKDIFIEDARIGIKKADRGQTEDDGFFKQFAFAMKKGFSFACIADVGYPLKSDSVFMGADRSVFKMTVLPFDKGFPNLFAVQPVPDRLVLLGDAHVSNDIYTHCDFAITATLSFRNIKSSTGNYSFRKGNLHTLLKRGSVLYPAKDQRPEVENLLNQPNLQKIGYNIFN